MFNTTHSSLKTHSYYSCSYADRATLHCSSFISHNLKMTLLTWTFCPFSFTYFLFPLFFFFFFFCFSNFFNSVSGSAEWCLSVPSNSILEDLEYYHFISFHLISCQKPWSCCVWLTQHTAQYLYSTLRSTEQQSTVQYSTANHSKRKHSTPQYSISYLVFLSASATCHFLQNWLSVHL